MKKAYGLLLNTCAITVLTVTVLFTFATAMSGQVFVMTFPAFLAVVLMSAVIALCGLIFDLEFLSPITRIIIHVFALLAAIFGVLGFTGYLASRKTVDYFVIVFIYFFLYALIFFGSRLCRMLYSKAVSHLDSGNNKSCKNGGKAPAKSKATATEKDKKSKSEYTPLYK